MTVKQQYPHIIVEGSNEATTYAQMRNKKLGRYKFDPDTVWDSSRWVPDYVMRASYELNHKQFLTFFLKMADSPGLMFPRWKPIRVFRCKAAIMYAMLIYVPPREV